MDVKAFGGVGVVKIDVGGGNDYSTKLKVLENGKILVGGHTWIANEPFLKYDVNAAQLDEDGNLDNSFGNNGIVKTNIIDGENYCKGFTIQPDGKIVVAGEYVDYRTYNILLLDTLKMALLTILLVIMELQFLIYMDKMIKLAVLCYNKMEK